MSRRPTNWARSKARRPSLNCKIRTQTAAFANQSNGGQVWRRGGLDRRPRPRPNISIRRTPAATPAVSHYRNPSARWEPPRRRESPTTPASRAALPTGTVTARFTHGSLRFDTSNSAFNTILAVYTGPGNSFSTLTNVGAALHHQLPVDTGQPTVLVSNTSHDKVLYCH